MIRWLFHRLPDTLNPVCWAQRRYRRYAQGTIQAGPFANMPYIDRAFCSALVPKLAGTYEKELHPWLDHVRQTQPDVFVDVGAAEGYYAIGIAAKGWCRSVIAFESDPAARAACRQLAERVGLAEGRLDIRNEGSVDGIASVLESSSHPMLLIDAEGAECYLLDPLRSPVLARTEILVEYHDFLVGGTRNLLIERFGTSHEIEAITPMPRDARDLVCTHWTHQLYPGLVRRLMLSENRPFYRHGWLWMKPRAIVKRS